MSNGKVISVRYSDEEIMRLEEAAALAGFKDISKYIRHRLFDRDSKRAGVEISEISEHLAELEHGQGVIRSEYKIMKMVMAISFWLIKRKASSGEISELRAELLHGASSEGLLAESLPELEGLMQRLRKEAV